MGSVFSACTVIVSRQSVVLASLLSLTVSQYTAWPEHKLQFGGEERRRFARRVFTVDDQSVRNILGRDEANRRMFSPIFSDDLTDFNEPYLMIDSQKFTVLPAVPHREKINQRSQKSLNSRNNQNFLFPSTSNNLKPVPAVPVPVPVQAPKTKSTKKPERVKNHNIAPKKNIRHLEPKSTSPPTIINNVNNNQVSQVREKTVKPQDREERKKFRACHGRCVQKFCLPVGSLAKHSVCQDTCKDICTP